MKIFKRIIIVFIGIFTLLVFSSCVFEEEKKEASFDTTLTILEEKENSFLCAVSLEPLGGIFSQSITEEEISFEEDLKEATNFEIVSSTNTLIEFTITIPSKGQEKSNYEINGIIKLSKGVIVSESGEEFGECAKYETFTHLDNNYQDNNPYFSTEGEISLVHSGAYIAKYYITWDLITGWTNIQEPYDLLEDEFNELPYEEKLKYATPVIEKQSWKENGKSKTNGYKETIKISGGFYGITNVRVIAQVKTGLIWDPLNDICDLTLENKAVKIEISGTTLNTKYNCNAYKDMNTTIRDDEVFFVSDFNYIKTDHDTVLCQTTLTIKDNYSHCKFDKNVVVSVELINKQTIYVTNDEESQTISFEFEIPINEWNNQRKKYNIFIKEGLSSNEEFLTTYKKNLSIVVQ